MELRKPMLKSLLFKLCLSLFSKVFTHPKVSKNPKEYAATLECKQ